MPTVRFANRARRVFDIAITASADGFAGTLSVDEVTDKQLESHRCDDLVAALALVTAIAIDPTAVTLDPPPGPTNPPNAASDRTPAANRPPAATHPSPPTAEVTAVAPARRTRMPWRIDLAVGGDVSSGISPGALFAGLVALRVGRGAFDVELAALAGYDSSQTTAGDGSAMATFTWFAARPAACWIALRRQAFDGAACAHAEIGAVRAGAEQIVNQRDLTRLWLAAGGHLRARIATSARTFAQLQVGVSAPIARDRYLFAPNVTVHETPALSAWVSVGVGLRFP